MTAKAVTTTYVYSFKDGDGKNKKLLGGKGANLCEMTQIGINVPPGFVISTDACLNYLDTKNQDLPAELMAQVREQIEALEQDTGKGFGDADARHDGYHPQPGIKCKNASRTD